MPGERSEAWGQVVTEVGQGQECQLFLRIGRTDDTSYWEVAEGRTTAVEPRARQVNQARATVAGSGGCARRVAASGPPAARDTLKLATVASLLAQPSSLHYVAMSRGGSWKQVWCKKWEWQGRGDRWSAASEQQEGWGSGGSPGVSGHRWQRRRAIGAGPGPEASGPNRGGQAGGVARAIGAPLEDPGVSGSERPVCPRAGCHFDGWVHVGDGFLTLNLVVPVSLHDCDPVRRGA